MCFKLGKVVSDYSPCSTVSFSWALLRAMIAATGRRTGNKAIIVITGEQSSLFKNLRS